MTLTMYKPAGSVDTFFVADDAVVTISYNVLADWDDVGFCGAASATISAIAMMRAPCAGHSVVRGDESLTMAATAHGSRSVL